MHFKTILLSLLNFCNSLLPGLPAFCSCLIQSMVQAIVTVLKVQTASCPSQHLKPFNNFSLQTVLNPKSFMQPITPHPIWPPSTFPISGHLLYHWLCATHNSLFSLPKSKTTKKVSFFCFSPQTWYVHLLKQFPILFPVIFCSFVRSQLNCQHSEKLFPTYLFRVDLLLTLNL